jgi:hypothetical protein
MPDSGSIKTEQAVQPLFSKASVFSYLGLILIFAAVMLSGGVLKGPETRSVGASRAATVSFTPIKFDGSSFAPLDLAGAWSVTVADSRFGGVSAVALDSGALLALTDAGSLAWLPKPGTGTRAIVSDLPDGPGSPDLKMNRDTEALARDPSGRGWWVAFEHCHQLWLYDPNFRRALLKIDFGPKRWSKNRGIEALIPLGKSLFLFPEPGDEWLQWRSGRAVTHPLESGFGFISDGVRLSDGRVLLVTRSFGLSGIDKHLVQVERKGDRIRLRELATLALGAMDNVEAIAAEPRDHGGTRLWLMTDNDFRPRAPTVLVALDLP